MNIQEKLYAFAARRLVRNYQCLILHLLSGGLITVLANPALAMDSDCRQTLMVVEQGMKSRMPADPKIAQAILNLRREGNELCLKGSTKPGQAKLQEAAALLESGELKSTQAQPKE